MDKKIKYLEFKKIVDSIDKISNNELVTLFNKFGNLNVIEFIDEYVNETGLKDKFDYYFNNYKLEIDEDSELLKKTNYSDISLSFLDYLNETKKYPLLSDTQVQKLYDTLKKCKNSKNKIDYNNLLFNIKRLILFSDDILIPDAAKVEYKKLLTKINNKNYKLNIKELINIKRLLNVINNYNLLNDEIKSLINTIDLAIEYNKAREILIVSNLRLVISVAKLYQNKGVDIEDLIQEGNMGLMKAIEKYDPSKGFKFSTYATWWIKQSITRNIYNFSRTIKIPENLYSKINKYLYVMKQFSLENNLNPTIEQIASRLGLKCENDKDKFEIEKAISEYQSYLFDVCSLETQINSNNSTDPIYLMDIIASDTNIELEYEDDDLKENIKKDINNYISSSLNDKQKNERYKIVFIICLRTGLALNHFFNRNQFNKYLNYLSYRINNKIIVDAYLPKANRIYSELVQCYDDFYNGKIVDYPMYSLSDIGLVLGVSGECARQLEEKFKRQGKNFVFARSKEDHILIKK